MESISISVMDKARVESQERSGLVLRKPYAPAFGFKNTQALPQRVKACSVSGFALLSYGEEPCPLRLQTVFSTQKPSQNRSTDFAWAKPACFRCTQSDPKHLLLSLI